MAIVKTDKADRKLLACLERDARIPVSILARKSRVSRAVAEYRLRRLEESGVIRGYYCLLDPSKFGLTVWKLWISLHTKSSEARAGFFKYIEQHPKTWWYAECVGLYDAVICVLSRTPYDFNSFISSLHDKYGELIADSAILINVSFEYHTRGFIAGNDSELIESSFQEKSQTVKVSSAELEVLQALSKNCRESYAGLAQATGLNVKTVMKKIKELKKSGVIVFFRPSIDTSKLGFEFYKVLLYLHNSPGGILPSITYWCRQQRNIVAVISCVGPWQLELEVEIDTYRNLCSMLTGLRDRFPAIIKSHEILLVTREGNFELDLANRLGQ